MNRPTCLSCVYHSRNPLALGQPGECRVENPSPVVLGMHPQTGQPIVINLFPQTPATLWCGKHPGMVAYAEYFNKKQAEGGWDENDGDPGGVDTRGSSNVHGEPGGSLNPGESPNGKRSTVSKLILTEPLD